MPQIVTTVGGRTMDEVRRARDAAAAADLVEVRLDGVDQPDPLGALEGRRRPVIVTCRPPWEGGRFEGSEEERGRLLSVALEAGAEFVDVEYAATFATDLLRRRRGRGVIVSMHVFGAGKAEPASRLEALRATGAEICKLAIEVQSLCETLPLFELARHASDGSQGHVLIAMGPHGVHTRILAARLGNRWSYAGSEVGPGQLSTSKMLDEFQFHRIQANAGLYGVAGRPIGHSLSPAMHNAGFCEAGLAAVFATFEPRDIGDFVAFARAMNLRGASITAPLKVEVLAHVDEQDEIALEVGAANTLMVNDGRWRASNTDVPGFLVPLRGRVSLAGARATVVGAGGAARAVAVALKHERAEVSICARRSEAGEAVASALGVRSAGFPPAAGTWDVLVNATPVGSRPGDVSPLEGVSLDGEIVYDLVYWPRVTPLLEQAARSGCRTISGLEMLVAQAERQFEMWTGTTPPRGLFQAAADAALMSRTGAMA